jgi:lipoprotein-anchoring transpeptidase ErfK/SrfK
MKRLSDLRPPSLPRRLDPRRLERSWAKAGRIDFRRPQVIGVAVVVALLLGVTAALVGSSGGPGGSSSVLGHGRKGAAAKVAQVRLTTKPGDHAGGVPLDAHVRVDAANGHITDVQVTPASGKALAGSLTSDGRTWRSSGALAPGIRYRVAVTAADQAGASTRQVSSFTTLTPSHVLSTSIMPIDGQTVGVGMPIAVWFNQPVTDRAAVERRLQVRTSSGLEGAWRWFGDREVHFRPQKFWPAGERVTLGVGLAGVRAGPGTWGVTNRTIHFQIGDRRVSTVNAKSHTMKVTVNDKVVKTIPVSTGRDKYPTTNGVHFVVSKEQDKLMDSATVGIPRNSPDGYYEHVFWSVRISNSGEFVHAAPWSVGSQGRANVSHGCVNMSTENAQWFFKLARPGDVVTVTGSPKKPNSWTLGVADWNISWSRWRQGSAL